MNPVDQDLPARLTELGRRIEVPAVEDDLAVRVLARDPLRVRRRRTRRLRWAGAVAVALLIALALTPPVRAAVSDLLRVGGVLIQPVPTAPTAPPEVGPVRPGGTPMRLPDARDAVAFDLVLPEDLGAPEEILVSDDRRVVSMRWGTGSDRIVWDQFDGELSPVFVKQVWSEAEQVQVHDRGGALWLAEAHPIVYLDADGVEHTAGPRLAGPTLIFVHGSVTIRLEGDLSRGEAIRIAESAPA